MAQLAALEKVRPRPAAGLSLTPAPALTDTRTAAPAFDTSHRDAALQRVQAGLDASPRLAPLRLLQRQLDVFSGATKVPTVATPVVQRLVIQNAAGTKLDIDDTLAREFCFYLRENHGIDGNCNTEKARIAYLNSNVEKIINDKLYALFIQHKQQRDEAPRYPQQQADKDFASQKDGAPLYDGTHISFMDNVVSGVNGYFDMTFLPDVPRINIWVKMKLPAPTSPTDLRPLQISASLAATAKFWSGQYGLRPKAGGNPVGIFVHILEVDKGQHYTYNDLDSKGGRPNVIRDVDHGSTFSTTTVRHDKNLQDQARRSNPSIPEDKLPQIASYHEMGHVLGLNEEYDLDTRGRTHPHEELTVDQRANPLHGDFSTPNVSGSIMGPDNGKVQLQHFGPIRQAFAKMTKTQAANWDIVKLQ